MIGCHTHTKKNPTPSRKKKMLRPICLKLSTEPFRNIRRPQHRLPEARTKKC